MHRHRPALVAIASVALLATIAAPAALAKGPNRGVGAVTVQAAAAGGRCDVTASIDVALSGKRTAQTLGFTFVQNTGAQKGQFISYFTPRQVFTESAIEFGFLAPGESATVTVDVFAGPGSTNLIASSTGGPVTCVA